MKYINEMIVKKLVIDVLWVYWTKLRDNGLIIVVA